ncbi:hypothetical protein HK097_002401, partial [Rhizophlyctis rosea]
MDFSNTPGDYGAASADYMGMGMGHPDDEDNEQVGGKRKRITQACDACNKKKVKCDGTKPTCANCQRSNQSCSYSRGAKKRGPRAGYIESLENRLKEMEALLKPLQSDGKMPEGGIPGFDGFPKSGSMGGPSAGSSASSEGGDSHGDRGGDDFGSSGQYFNSPAMGYNSPVQSSIQPTPSAIPPEATAELIELYFHYVYPIMPLIHKPTFMRNLPNESPLMLNAMYAVAARYSQHPAIRTNPNALYNSGDVFYIKARELVDHYMDVPNVSTVNALLVLATYAAGSGRGSAAWMYSGMAIRMAQELKLNVEPEFEEAYASANRLSWLERETRRRLWWCCFVLDRYAGAAADRSMIINEKDCKVYLPSNEYAWNSVNEVNDEPSEIGNNKDSFQIAVLTSTNMFTPGIPAQNGFGYFVLLTKIFGKIVEYSNHFKNPQRNGGPGSANPTVTTPIASGTNPSAPGANAAPDTDYQLSILDASLRDWFASLPDWMRTVGDVYTNELGSRNPPSWQIAYLHIFYHTCVILLHRPKMMIALREQPQSVQFSPPFIVCNSSAGEISAVISKVMATNPNFYYFSPFTGFCIFQSGLIHVMAAQVSNDPGIVKAAQRNVEVHVAALGGVAKYWFMGGRLHSVLRNLIESAK